MAVPSFLIIGAQKAGTTALVNYLGRHPDIFVPEHKEISNCFDDEEYNRRFTRFPYENYFSGWNGQMHAGNAPVNLLYFAASTSGRIYDFNPRMKLIVILRNPIHRAYSAYWYFVRCGLERESFESALDREKEILRNGSFREKSNFTYVSHGLYGDQIGHFMARFGENQLLVLLYEDFKSDPAGTLRHVYAFLGVAEHLPHDMLDRRFNAASKPRIEGLHRFVYGENPVKTIYKKLLPERFRYRVRMGLIRGLLNRNLEAFQYPPMKESTRLRLAQAFDGPNERLEKRLGISLHHWRLA